MAEYEYSYLTTATSTSHKLFDGNSWVTYPIKFESDDDIEDNLSKEVIQELLDVL